MDLDPLIAVSCLDLHPLIVVSRLDLQPLLAVSRLDLDPLIAVSCLDLHPLIAVSRFVAPRGRTPPAEHRGARVQPGDGRRAVRGRVPEPLQLARDRRCPRRRDPPAAALERHSGGDWQERLRH